jgi:hypothetical protein
VAVRRGFQLQILIRSTANSSQSGSNAHQRLKLALPVVDRDIEQCAIIKIIAVVEVREIVRKLTGPKAWMRHRCDQTAIRAKKSGDSRQCVQASFATGKAHPDCIKGYDIKYSGLNFLYRFGHADLFEIRA